MLIHGLWDGVLLVADISLLVDAVTFRMALELPIFALTDPSTMASIASLR